MYIQTKSVILVPQWINTTLKNNGCSVADLCNFDILYKTLSKEDLAVLYRLNDYDNPHRNEIVGASSGFAFELSYLHGQASAAMGLASSEFSQTYAKKALWIDTVIAQRLFTADSAEAATRPEVSGLIDEESFFELIDISATTAALIVKDGAFSYGHSGSGSLNYRRQMRIVSAVVLRHCDEMTYDATAFSPWYKTYFDHLYANALAAAQ
jgi:hypothetical protein